MTPPLTRYRATLSNFIGPDSSIVGAVADVYLAAVVDAMLDAFFAQLASGWDIEPREVFEREAPTNGFKWPICQALHHTWKRDVKEAAQDETLETLRRDQEHWKLEAEAWKSAYDTEHADKTALEGALERLRAAQTTEPVGGPIYDKVAQTVSCPACRAVLYNVTKATPRPFTFPDDDEASASRPTEAPK